MRVTTMRKTLTLCLFALALPAGAQSYLDRISDYIENTSVFEENQEPGRAFHLPEQALSLNGTWKFGYFESPTEVPADFFKPAFNDRKWLPAAGAQGDAGALPGGPRESGPAGEHPEFLPFPPGG